MQVLHRKCLSVADGGAHVCCGEIPHWSPCNDRTKYVHILINVDKYVHILVFFDQYVHILVFFDQYVAQLLLALNT